MVSKQGERRGVANGNRERTMKRAFGIPLGFFSSCWTMSVGAAEAEVDIANAGTVQ